MKEFVYGEGNEHQFSIDKMVEDLKVGIKRALSYGIKRFIAVETPMAYKTSLYKAVNDLNLWDIFTIIDSRIGTMDLNLKLVNVALKHHITGYLYHDVYSYKFSEKMKNITPDEFRFDQSSHYKNITDLGIVFSKIQTAQFNHLYPKMLSDNDKTFSEITDFYSFPYKTPLYYVE
jgi:hypothetical protein